MGCLNPRPVRVTMTLADLLTGIITPIRYSRHANYSIRVPAGTYRVSVRMGRLGQTEVVHAASGMTVTANFVFPCKVFQIK